MPSDAHQLHRQNALFPDFLAAFSALPASRHKERHSAYCGRKKNFLFVGHPEAGWKSAVFYSLFESCRRLGINAEKYLTDVMTQLPDMQQSELEQHLPAQWIKRHPEARFTSSK